MLFGRRYYENTAYFNFDEVQDCPKVINSMKYSCENAPQYHIACAGSLLGIALAKPFSFPVGKVNFMHLIGTILHVTQKRKKILEICAIIKPIHERMKGIIMQVKVKKVDTASEERAEICAVSITEEIRNAINLLEHTQQSIPVTGSESTMLCPLSHIYYFDSVDNHTFVYTRDNCFETKYRLYELEGMLSCDFFRCSKSMIINIRKIASVNAEINARMRATLLNGEAVIISRNYVKDLKEKLGI